MFARFLTPLTENPKRVRGIAGVEPLREKALYRLMMNAKPETITFKVDAQLAKILSEMPNRSEFIRAAVLNALDNTCPLCQGTGSITPQQKKHWNEFLAHHHLERCGECNAIHIVCDNEKH